MATTADDDAHRKEEDKKNTSLFSALTTLERSRCLHAELEACVLLSSTVLSLPPNEMSHELPPDLSETLPGGVKDAHMTLADFCYPSASESNDGVAIAAVGTTAASNTTSSQNAEYGRGQLAAMIKNVAMSASLDRAVNLSSSLTKNQARDGDVYKSMLQAMEVVQKRGDNDAAGGNDEGEEEPPLRAWFDSFYERLRQVREYHAKHDTSFKQSAPHDVPLFPTMPDDTDVAMMDITKSNGHHQRSSLNNNKKRIRVGYPEADGYDLSSILTTSCQNMIDSSFSGDEVFGKYLDLNEIHDFITQKGINTIFSQQQKGTTTDATTNNNDSSSFVSYSEFLSVLKSGLATSLTEYLKLKHRKKYVQFLNKLKDYLINFLKKTSPLLDVKKEIIQISEKQFESEWGKRGGVEGWEEKKDECMLVLSTESNSNTNPLDLSNYSSAEELEKNVRKQAITSELDKLGMKSGGTPLDRAKRLFMTKDKPLSELPPKLFKKKNNKVSPAAGSVSVKQERRVDIARLEAIVIGVLNQLRPTLEATARRAERRLTQTANEREREVQEEIHGISTLTASNKIKRLRKSGDGESSDSDEDEADSDEDSDTPIYNPKGVPLGFDGKPIPYWLFKLHGLNYFYNCEICGNESYRGRRNFEKHFTESKHSYGMRCLGIPNTKHFHGVTKIEDAQKLWEQLKQSVEGGVFDGSKEEEYEDSHGNVLKRGEYEDLARQGLL